MPIQHSEFRLKNPASRHHAFLGATLIEMVVITVMICCAFLGAHYALKAMGAKWWWLGAIVGFFLPLVLAGLLALLSDLAIGGLPHLPQCLQGTCRGSNAYKSGKFGEEYHLVCRHGGRYKRRDRRFVIVNENGRETPYLVWRPFRGWFPDGSVGE